MRFSSRSFLPIASVLSVAILLPIFALAQPGAAPPLGVVDARFNSVAVSNGTSDYLLIQNNGHIENPTGDRVTMDDHFDLQGNFYMHGGTTGNNSRLINEDTWFDGVRTLGYPIFIDDDVQVTNKLTAAAVESTYGGFGELTAVTKLMTNLVSPVGFNTSTQFPFSIDLKGHLYNEVAPLEIGSTTKGNQDVIVNTHFRALDGIGSVYSRSNITPVTPGLYTTLSVACDGSDMLISCGAGGVVGVTSAFELNYLRPYPYWSNTCQVVATNKWATTRELEVFARCWNLGAE